MAIPTVPVTVTLAAQDGASIAGVVVTARLDMNEVYQGVVISEPVAATTDASGVAILNLFPNSPDPAGLGTQGSTYRVSATIPGGRSLNVYARVPNTPSRIENILVPGDDAVTLDAAQLAILQAQQGATQAATSAAAAAASEATAVAARDDTLAAKEIVEDLTAGYGDVSAIVADVTAKRDQAATSAAASASSASAAAGSEAGAALSAQQAAASANARPSIAAANADTTIPIGGSFVAPLSNGLLQTYQKTSSSGSSATSIGQPFLGMPTLAASSDLNLWVDALFRTITTGLIGTTVSSSLNLLGRSRVLPRLDAASAAVAVASTPFNAPAFTGTTNAVGFDLQTYLDEAGVAPGDAVTVVVAVGLPAGAGSVSAQFYARAGVGGTILETSPTYTLSGAGNVLLFAHTFAAIPATTNTILARLTPAGGNTSAVTVYGCGLVRGTVQRPIVEDAARASDVRRTPDGAVYTSAMRDKAVTPAKTSFFVAGTNKCDPAAAVTGYSVNGGNGVPQVNASYCYVDIPVDPSTQYSVSEVRTYAWLTADKVYISGNSTSTGTPGTIGNSPSSAAYCRYSIPLTSIGVTFRFNVGATVLPYEAYQIRIAPQFLVLTGSMFTDNSVNGTKLSDASVPAVKLQFMAVGRNLFDKSAATIGSFLNNTGSTGTSATYDYSAKIAVTPGVQYTSNSQMRFTCFFAADGVTVVAGGASSGSSTLTPPAGAAYVVVTLTHTYLDGFQLNVGATALPFDPFRYASTLAPVRLPYLNPSALRRSRLALQVLKQLAGPFNQSAQPAATKQFVLGLFGDSWTQNYQRYSGPLEYLLRVQQDLGDAGAGFVGFGIVAGSTTGGSGTTADGNVRGNGSVNVTYIGAWTSGYRTAVHSPYLCDAYPTTSGDTAAAITVGVPAGHSTVLLLATGGAGQVAYSWDGGAETTVDLSALPAGLQSISLAGVPSLASTLKLRGAGGQPHLDGVVLKKAGPGITVHKLGASGSRSDEWAAANATSFQAGVVALGVTAAAICLCTNDQSAPLTPSQVVANHKAMVDRILAANAKCDILIVAPCENGRGLSMPMGAYAAALQDFAATNGYAFLDLQPLYGVQYADYSDLFNADLLHPDPPKDGGLPIVEGLSRLFLSAL